MRIGLLFPTIYASEVLYKDRIFAPRELLTNLSNNLVSRGHEVFVFSTPDFKTNAKLVGIPLDGVIKPLHISKFRNIEGDRREWLDTEFSKRNFELNVTKNAFQYVKQNKLDLLHCYHDSSLFFTHYFHSLFDFPIIYSLHDPLPPLETFEYSELSKFKTHMYISLSEQMRKSTLKLNFVANIKHGIDIHHFSFNQHPSDYLLFMGRLIPEKGLHSAIAVSLKTNIRLEIGTQFFKADEKANTYFVNKVKPYLNNSLIGKPRMFNDEEKRLAYQQAMAFIFPIEWEEPFGMVMIEAMSCGTPVIAYNRGSVPEVLRDGLTGFIIDPDSEDRPGKGTWVIKKQGIEGLVEAIQRIGEIDRRDCRKHVEENFSVEKMGENYEKIYQEVVKKTNE